MIPHRTNLNSLGRLLACVTLATTIGCDGTHAHQLAMSVVSFSPLQWLFWYDTPDLYRGEPEVEFFREVPTVWDETRVVHDEIGRLATIARRSGDEWFVGTICSEGPRTIDLPLDFLPANAAFTARIYRDDPSVDTRTHVGIETRAVGSASVIETRLLESGGQAVWIRPSD